MQAPNSQVFFLFIYLFIHVEVLNRASGPRIYTRCIGVNPRTGGGGGVHGGALLSTKRCKKKRKKRERRNNTKSKHALQ